jgi:hypothetical protein
LQKGLTCYQSIDGLHYHQHFVGILQYTIYQNQIKGFKQSQVSDMMLDGRTIACTKILIMSNHHKFLVNGLYAMIVVVLTTTTTVTAAALAAHQMVPHSNNANVLLYSRIKIRIRVSLHSVIQHRT